MIYADIILQNPKNDKIEPIKTISLVDTGSYHLCIPESIASKLCLSPLENRIVSLADGKKISVPYTGPILVQFKNRSTFVGAMVLGEEVLLGLVPLIDLDLTLHIASKSLRINEKIF